MHKNARESLLIVNGKAGKGKAYKTAEQLSNEYGLRAINLFDLLGPKEATQHPQLDIALQEITNFFVLGGDGSTFSFIEALLSTQLEQKVTVIPLGMGGENVLAKQAGTFEKPVESTLAVLENQHDNRVVKPFSVQLDKNNSSRELPFLWNVHAGFSAAVLYEIEMLREMKVTDFRRRYQGSIQALLQMRKNEPTYIHQGMETIKVLDSGIISVGLPYWTSKIQIPTQDEQAAILHSINGYDQLQEDPFGFITLFLKEMYGLKKGSEKQRSIITHQPLTDNFEVVLETSTGRIAVDSEVHLAQNAKTTGRKSEYPGSGNVFIASLEK